MTTPILLQNTAVVNVYNVHSALQNTQVTNSFKEIGQKLHCTLPKELMNRITQKKRRGEG